MVDSPYGLDFLQQVINVQFGGAFLLIHPQGQTTDTALESFSSEIDFTSIEGGTPGFLFEYSDPEDGSPGTIFMTGGKSIRAIPPLATPVVTAADLAKTLDSASGRAFRGFGYSQLGVINTFAAGYWFIDVSSFPPGTIHIHCDNEGESSDYNVQLFTYKQGIVKAGASVGSFITAKNVDTVTLPPADNSFVTLNTSTLKFGPVS